MFHTKFNKQMSIITLDKQDKIKGEGKGMRNENEKKREGK